MRIINLLVSLMLLPWMAWSQVIDRAEYFFDADPGAGNGTPITVSAPGTTVTFTTSIPTTLLSPGFHYLGMRFQQSDNLWSNIEGRGFYISTATNSAADLVDAEYFFDLDPGAGNGTPIAITPGPDATFSIVLPATVLTRGFHFVAIRVRDNSGVWGIFESRGFYISDAASAAADIVDAEYFFDTDPGTGNGEKIAVPTGAISNFTASLPATGLSPGFHMLAIRVKASDGKWGIFETRSFYITSDIGPAADIVAAEYFFNTDPGIGNATPLTVSPTGPTINQTFTIAVPGTLGEGTHTLSIRVRNADGVWSEHETSSFDIIINDPPVALAGSDQAITLPVNSVTLDGSGSTDPDGTIASFQWSKISGPAGENIVQETNATTNVDNLSQGVYEFELFVTDDKGFNDRDTVQITVEPEPNEIPVANAGSDQLISLPLNTVFLSGALSTDADGTLVSFAWTKVSGPAGEFIVDVDGISTDVTGLTSGVYTFQLTVTDNKGATDTDAVIVTVGTAGCPPVPVITQIEDRLVCNPPGDSYQWFLDGSPIAGETAQLLEINYIAYGNYTVQLTEGSCTTTSDVYTYLVTADDEVKESTAIFPNPFNQTLRIATTVRLPTKITLVDQLGRTILVSMMDSAVHEITMPPMAPGVYFVVINGKNWYKIQKF